MVRCVCKPFNLKKLRYTERFTGMDNQHMDVVNKKFPSGRNRFYYLGVPLAIFILLITFFLYHELKEYEFISIKQQVQDVNNIMLNPMKNAVKNYARILRRMGDRWELMDGTPKKQWYLDANNYLKDANVFQAIAWVDKGMHLRWMVPEKENAKYHNLDLSKIPSRKQVLLQAKKVRQAIVSNILNFMQGPRGFLVIMPLFIHDKQQFDGYIIGAIDINRLFKQLFPNGFGEDYGVAIYQDGVPVYTSSDALDHPFLIEENTMTLFNIQWKIYTWPTAHLLRALHTMLPLVVLGSGILSALLVLIIFYFYQQSLDRSQRIVTERETAEKTANRLQKIIETVHEGYLAFDEQGTLVDWNPYAEKIFGQGKNAVLGKNVHELMIPKQHREQHRNELKKFIKSGDVSAFQKEIEFKALRHNGEEFPVEVVIFPIMSDHHYTFHAFVRDLTERKKVDRLKNEFIAVVSHELRTPLTSIRGSLGLLISEKICTLSSKAKELLTIANNNCERLIRLINDILDIEKIETGKMDFHFKEIDISLLLQEVVRNTIALAAKSNIQLQLTTEKDLFVSADHERLTQVVVNLLSNAIHFSKSAGSIHIEAKNNVNHIRVSIADHGSGIPKEFHERIFSKFSQADSSDTREKGGTGLGLHISKAIIEKHHGTIAFESDQAKGSTFYFELPALIQHDAKEKINILVCDRELDETMSQPQSPKISDYINKRVSKKVPSILSVEDDDDVTHLIKLLLQDKANVWQAGTLEQTKKILQREEFDLIILDINMPDGSGAELLPFLNYKTKKTIPVIVFSIDELDEKYRHLVKQSLLKSKTSNEQLFYAIESAIKSEEISC